MTTVSDKRATTKPDDIYLEITHSTHIYTLIGIWGNGDSHQLDLIISQCVLILKGHTMYHKLKHKWIHSK